MAIVASRATNLEAHWRLGCEYAQYLAAPLGVLLLQGLHDSFD